MAIKLKPPELLKAQVAVYAASQREGVYPRREATLLERIGDVAVEGVDLPEDSGYLRPITSSYIQDGEIITVPKGVTIPLFESDQYKEILKDPQNREVAQSLADMISAYPKFAGKVEEMGVLGLDYYRAKNHELCIGQGASNSGFEFSMEFDGEVQDFVAIIPHTPGSQHNITKANSRAISLALVKGLKGFEQAVAVSYDTSVVISKKAKGVNLGQMQPKDKSSISLNHWEELRDNVRVASLKGVRLDRSPYNFFYDSEEGFTVIDFRNNYSDGRTVEQITTGNIHDTYLL